VTLAVVRAASGFALLALACGTTASALAAPDGTALFKQHCAICHQESAAGTVGLAPPLLGEHWQKLGADRSYLPTVLSKGLSGPIKVAGQSINALMPAFAGQVDDEALAAIANHLRGLQGAAADRPFVAADLAEARAKPGNQATTRALRRQILGE
jgi:mono/diheme cytochrome c family protein